MIISNFKYIGKKNNQTSVSDAEGEIPTLGWTDNSGNSVKLVSGIIRLPSGWFASETDDRFYFKRLSIWLLGWRSFIKIESTLTGKHFCSTYRLEANKRNLRN